MANRRVAENDFRFDKTISLGNIISILVFVVALFQAYVGITARMDVMQTKVDAMWTAFKLEVAK